jgi:hypothetical protein
MKLARLTQMQSNSFSRPILKRHAIFFIICRLQRHNLHKIGHILLGFQSSRLPLCQPDVWTRPHTTYPKDSEPLRGLFLFQHFKDRAVYRQCIEHFQEPVRRTNRLRCPRRVSDVVQLLCFRCSWRSDILKVFRLCSIRHWYSERDCKHWIISLLYLVNG